MDLEPFLSPPGRDLLYATSDLATSSLELFDAATGKTRVFARHAFDPAPSSGEGISYLGDLGDGANDQLVEIIQPGSGSGRGHLVNQLCLSGE